MPLPLNLVPIAYPAETPAVLPIRLQLMRLHSTYQVDYAIIFWHLVPLKDAMQIIKTPRLIMVSEEPIEGTGLSCVRFERC